MHSSRIHRRLTLCIAIIAGSMLPLISRAETVVIVSPKANISTISVTRAADIFLGKSKRFPDGHPAVPIDQTEDSATRQDFYLKASGKSISLMKAYWSKLVFTGEGQPPREISDIDTLKKLIAVNPSLIGYIDRSAVDDTVKIIAVLP